MDLFVLIGNQKDRIQRFSLSRKLKPKIKGSFEKQYDFFKKQYKNPVPFDGRYKAEEDEYLLIDNFKDPENFEKSIKSPLEYPEFNPTLDNLQQILAIFTGFKTANEKYVILLQNFEKRRIISPAGLSLFKAKNLFEPISGFGVTLDTKLAGILEGEKLAFTSYAAISRIFLLKDFYIEATDADVKSFSAMECFIGCDLAVLREISDTVVRRKIKAIEKSKILVKLKVSDINAVAADLGLDINFVGKGDKMQIVMPTDRADLKTVLSFLAEDIFRSPLTKLLMYTNSKRPHG